jgi:hypothetical protein
VERAGEILDRFLMSQSTLRRRRPDLGRLGIVFVERGRGSLYVAPGLAPLLASYLPATTPSFVRSARSNPLNYPASSQADRKPLASA